MPSTPESDGPAPSYQYLIRNIVNWKVRRCCARQAGQKRRSLAWGPKNAAKTLGRKRQRRILISLMATLPCSFQRGGIRKAGPAATQAHLSSWQQPPSPSSLPTALYCSFPTLSSCVTTRNHGFSPTLLRHHGGKLCKSNVLVVISAANSSPGHRHCHL